MNQTTSGAIERDLRSTLVLLFVILFVVSFVLLSTVALVQGRTIKSQRSLIRLLLEGRVHRSGLSSQVAVSHANPAPERNPAPARQLPPPSPSAQVPEVKVKPQITVKPGRKSRRAQEPFPARPPAELNDPSDMRRVSFSI